jgi:NitT/TauT family transport system substrate-binding protein
MQVSRRKAIAIAGLGAASLIGAPAIAQSRQKVVMGQPSEGFIYLPIYVARTKGFFEQEGLDHILERRSRSVSGRTGRPIGYLRR